MIVIAVPGVSPANRYMYGVFDPWSPPERFDFCGAHFCRTQGGPQDPQAGQLDSLLFLEIGPDRYLELTDAD